MWRRILACFMLLSVSYVNLISCSSVFRFGAVLSTLGSKSHFSFAKNGYQLFIDLINAQSGGRGFFLRGKPRTKGFYFKYEFLSREDYSDFDIHTKEVKNLVMNENIHFLGGSESEFANEEMRISNEKGILNFQCCVGPDEFYEQDYKNVFGIMVSNRDYTRMLIQSLSLENVKYVRIIADESNPFTRSTCEAALEFAKPFWDNSTGLTRLEDVRFNATEDKDYDLFLKFAKQSKKSSTEAVIACVLHDEATMLVNAFHEIKYSLKSFFITVAPASYDWIKSFEKATYKTDNLLSAAQWHRDMKYSDDFFGNGLEYVELYQDHFNRSEPTYVSACASAVGLTLHQAILQAFEKCDISSTDGNVTKLLFDATSIKCDNGDSNMTGNERILVALSNTNAEIFFGRIKFNRYRRNVGFTPVTTQVFKVKHDVTKEEKREIKAVLPLGYATSLLKFPAENHYQKKCQPGSFVGPDPYDRCKPCGRGTVSFKNDSDHCDNCPLGEYMERIGEVSCEKCPAGSHTEDRGSISHLNCICLPGYYHPSELSGIECFKCPEGATCNGTTNQPYPNSGFWMNESWKANAYSCDSENHCVGGPEFACKEGTTGRLCSECADGYFGIINKCYKCLPHALIVLFCILLLVSWYVINVIVSRSVASLEMLLGWAQLANVIGDIDLNWPPMLTRVFELANILDFDVDILEPSCLIKGWGFLQNFIVQLCLPFVMSLMAGFGFLLSLCVYFLIKWEVIETNGRTKKFVSWFIAVPESVEDLEYRWDVTLATFLASVDITYVTIAKYCFDVFKCDYIAGENVLHISPDVLCDSREHYILVSLGIFGILFYVLGYFANVSWTLYILHKKKSFPQAKNLRRFGFIYEKFELDYYYTPIIIILRKALFVAALVFLNDPSFQLGALAIIINASLMLHVFTAPYVDTYIDILFSFLLLALMFEAFGGLMFYNDNLPSQNRFILKWIVMLTLFLLILVFLVIFIMEMMNKYHILRMKKMHRTFALDRLDSSVRDWTERQSEGSTNKGILRKAVSIATHVRRKRDHGISFELLDTFKPSFVYQCLTKDESFIEDWDKLTNMLKDYMSDESPTSYLSVEPGAKFWRKMVDRFPEIVDFLLVVDDDSREKFKHFADHLFKDFYLTNKVVSLPLMQILNWRDRAPMAHWLCTADKDDRDFFFDTITKMYRMTEHHEIHKMLTSKRENGGADPELHQRIQSRGISEKQRRTLQHIASGQSAMDHPALRKATTAVVAVQAFKNLRTRSEANRLKDSGKVDESLKQTDGENGSHHADRTLNLTRNTLAEEQNGDIELVNAIPLVNEPSTSTATGNNVKEISKMKKQLSANSDNTNNKSVSFKEAAGNH